MLSTGLGSTTEHDILPAYATATQSNSRTATYSPIVERDCNGPLRTANPEASPPLPGFTERANNVTVSVDGTMVSRTGDCRFIVSSQCTVAYPRLRATKAFVVEPGSE